MNKHEFIYQGTAYADGEIGADPIEISPTTKEKGRVYVVTATVQTDSGPKQDWVICQVAKLGPPPP